VGLRAKFNLVMAIAFLVGLALAGALSYTLVQDNARRQVLNEAAVMNGQASAISVYTAREIAPLLASQFSRRFLPQSVPAWAAQTNFRTLQQSFPDYSFRTVMLNPTNPADQATGWQADIIESLRRDGAKELVTERETPTGRILYVASPITITDPACLVCHSTPSAAPATMVDLYGSDHGFNWKLNEVLGAQIVSVPMQVPLARANQTFLTVMAGLACVFLVMLVLLNILLHRVIIRPVSRIAATANEVSMGNMEAPEVIVRGRDEIASLAASFNRMRRSLANALRMLGE
jgi:HAMP domain-containing protein